MVAKGSVFLGRFERGWLTLFPSAVAVLLSAPCLSATYIWDDYNLLTGPVSALLLPQPGSGFYRPVSQGIYFLLLRWIDPTNGLVAHLLNLTLLALAVLLLVVLVSRIAGTRAGVIAGLVYACLGSAPSLVVWVSLSQDLLAICFILAAFLLRDSGRNALALICAALAVLSKEPAICAVPVLIFWDRLVGRKTPRLGALVVSYALMVFAWLLVHPGIHAMLGGGLRRGAIGYLRLTQPSQWASHLGSYTLTLVNMVPGSLGSSLWESRFTWGMLALATLLGGWFLLAKDLPNRPEATPRRLAGFSALLSIPALLLPAILLPFWAPYFSCLPAIGVAVFLGTALAARGRFFILSVLVAFLALGIWYRGGMPKREPVWTERVLVQASDAAKRVRSRFKEAFPILPHNATVLVSVGSTGTNGILSTLVEGQALQVWYRDPTVRAIPILDARPQKPGETQYLVRITPDLDLLSIDPYVPRIRAFPPASPDESEVVRPIIAYARAVAASGDVDVAVRVSDGLSRRDPRPAFHSYYRRMSAAFLLSAGRTDEANQVLATTPAFGAEQSRQFVWKILAEPSSNEAVDLATFEAFGLSPKDSSTLAWLMEEFKRRGAVGQAAWIAQRLWEANPGDPRSLNVIRDAALHGVEPSRMPTRRTE